jgi:hypothetical protein
MSTMLVLVLTMKPVKVSKRKAETIMLVQKLKQKGQVKTLSKGETVKSSRSKSSCRKVVFFVKRLYRDNFNGDENQIKLAA